MSEVEHGLKGLFSGSIELGGIMDRQMMNNTLILEVASELVTSVFTTSIASKNLDSFDTLLNLCLGLVPLVLSKGFGLLLCKVKPAFVRVTVLVENGIFCSIQ